jgi:hypothetical protein
MQTRLFELWRQRNLKNLFNKILELTENNIYENAQNEQNKDMEVV